MDAEVMREFRRLQAEARGGGLEAKEALAAFRREHRLYDEITLDDEDEEEEGQGDEGEEEGDDDE